MRKWLDLFETHVPPKFETGDEEHYDALEKTGFFGAQAAGCVPMCAKTGRLMLVLRSRQVEEPGTWGNVGGAHKSSETPIDAARREFHEETGYSGSVEMIPLLIFKSGTFRYCNFLAVVGEEFVPHLGWEADDYKWIEFGDWPSPLHFGVKSLMSDAASIQTIEKFLP